MHYVYMAKTRSGKIYVGVSNNPQRRIKEHNDGRGSIHTKKGVFTIVFLEEHDTLPEARQREIQIKDWRREKKEKLIERYRNGLPTKQ